MENSENRTIKGSRFNFDIIILIVIDLLLVFELKASFFNKAGIVIIFTIVGLILISSRFHYFSYNANELIVKHLWFGTKKRYLLSKIESIEIKKSPYNGRAIVIRDKYGHKGIFVSAYIKREELAEMIDFITKHIGKQ